MFTEKESNILQALIEEELTHVMSYGEDPEAFLADYRTCLSTLLLKIKMDNFTALSAEYRTILKDQFAQRQMVA